MKRPRKSNGQQLRQHAWEVRKGSPDWDSLSDEDARATPPQSIASADQRVLKWREATRAPSSARSPIVRRRRAVRIRQERQPRTISSRLLEQGEAGAILLASMAGDIAKRLLRILRVPIQWLVTLWILCFILSYFYMHWAGVLQRAVSPLCNIPLLQNYAICQPDYLTQGAAPAADYPKLMELQGNLEKLLEKSVGGSTLAFDLKHSQIAVQELKSLVMMSQLMCRERLANKLESFVNSARTAGRDLQRLGSRVGGSVDGVLAVNDYALRAIEAANVANKRPRIVSALMPWHTPSHKEISDIFVTSMTVMEENMRHLITEAEVAVVGLDNLEVQLGTIHEMTSREQGLVGLQRETLLRDIWTLLGANRDRMKQYSHHLILLENISTYRKRALAHVAATLVQLQQLSHDLQELRERVSRPALLADRPEIPLEVHIMSIRKGIERLDAGRLRTQQLESDALRRMIDAGPNVEIVQ